MPRYEQHEQVACDRQLIALLQIEAGVEHSQELATLREQSKAVADQLKTAHQTEKDALIASHQDALDSQVKALEKQIASLKVELSATQDTLAKTKAASASSGSQVEALQAQLEQGSKDAEAAKAAAVSEKDAEGITLAHKDFSQLAKERLGAKVETGVAKRHNHISLNCAVGTGDGEEWAEEVAKWAKAVVSS